MKVDMMSEKIYTIEEIKSFMMRRSKVKFYIGYDNKRYYAIKNRFGKNTGK